MNTKLPVISIFLVSVLLAAGCGDDEPSSDNGTPATETAMTESEAPESDAPESDAPAPDASTSVADACELLTSDEIEASIGSGFKPEAKTGKTLDAFPLSQCVWEAGDAKAAVAVVGSAERYRMHEKRNLGEPVRKLGDGALVEKGTSLEDRGGTGGRTVFVLDGDRTLVVALDRGRSEEVTVDAVVELARTAHGRLR